MPSGPIGRTWVSGSWSDTAWEANSWLTGIAGSATATITVVATGSGIARRPQVLVSGGRVRPFIRPAIIHRMGGAIAAVGIAADGRGLARRRAASIATVELAATGRGRKAFTGAAFSAGVVREAGSGLAAHPRVPVLVRSRRQRYLAAVVQHAVTMDTDPIPVWSDDDDEQVLLEVA